MSGKICKTPNRVRPTQIDGVQRLQQMVVELQSKLSSVGIQQELTRDTSMQDVEHSKKRFRDPRLCRRPRAVDVRSPERLVGGDGERENPRCPQTGEVGRGRRRPVEGVDRRRSVHGRDMTQVFVRKVSTWGLRGVRVRGFTPRAIHKSAQQATPV